MEKWTNLRNGLGLRRLLRVVGSDTLSLDALGLGVLLVIGSEEVDLIVILLSLGGSSGSTAEEGLASRAGAREGAKLSLVGLDVIVPAGNVGVCGRVGGRRDGLEDSDVRLRRGVTAQLEDVSTRSFQLDSKDREQRVR